MLPLNGDPSIVDMSILSTRIGNGRTAEGMRPCLVSVVFVAAATIVLFSLASVSLLGTGKETLMDNGPIGEKVTGTVVPYTGSDATPVALQTKSPGNEAAAEPQSGKASAAQRAPRATMPRTATSNEQLDQVPPNFPIQRNPDANVDGGNVALTPEVHVPEEAKTKEDTGFYGSTARAGPDLASLHAAPHDRRSAKADRDRLADKLNRAELSRILRGGRALRRAQLQ